jgi:hypothetical protein
MSFDLDAIRKKIERLSGRGTKSNIQMWKADLGIYKIRVLPGKNLKEGVPFCELDFYYLNDKPVLAPAQFGKPDPVAELIKQLYRSGTPEDKAFAKTLRPNTRTYVPIVVRGEEDKGVLIWSCNKNVNLRLLGFLVEEDEDIANFMDPVNGLDLKVEIKASGKKFNDRPVNDIIVDPGRKSSPLHQDPAVAKKLLDSVPDPAEMWQLKSYEEIKQLLEDHISGGASPVIECNDEQPQKLTVDALDKLVDESSVQEQDNKSQKKPRKAPTKPTQEAIDDIDSALDALTK